MRISILNLASFCLGVNAFTPLSAKNSQVAKVPRVIITSSPQGPTSTSLNSSDFSDDFLQESADATQERIQELVDRHPVLLFMKGSKIFPQCGFSSTAVQILNTFNIDYHTVDVLADPAIRSGVKDFSNWPTIPQLYIAGEFLGGSDIMIEMYQNGELGELIEKSKADLM